MPHDGGDQQLPDAGTTLLVELADPGGARDVDLGHEPTDHVEPDEQHALRGERRADLAREPAVAIVQRAGDPGRAGGEVAPMILRRGYAGERVRHRLAVDEQQDRKSTRLNSSHVSISYAVFCLKKKKK